MAFIKVKCECKNEQIVFDKASSKIDCVICSKPLATSTGGKTKVVGEVVEVLE